MTETAEKSSVVRTQLIPLSDMQILLPNTCIAEIITLQELNPVKKTPDWFLGMMSWRGIRIPVISFEIANGLAMHEITGKTQVAVLNGLGGDDQLPFYGLVTQGIPKLMSLNKADVEAIAKPEQKLPMAYEQTTVADVTAAIPDQKKIEKLLLKEVKKIK